MQSLNKNVFYYKQHGEDVKRGVELLPVGAQHVDGNIRDNAAEDTVGDAVCKGIMTMVMKAGMASA